MRTRTHFLWLLLFSAVVGFASHDVGETDLASFFARTTVAAMGALSEVLGGDGSELLVVTVIPWQVASLTY